MYPDGQFVDLTSGPEWADFFFNKFYDNAYAPEDLVIHTSIVHGIALSELNPDNQSWQDGKKYFNVGNIIILTKHYEDYYENYYFHSDKDNHQINQFYLSNLDLLSKFIEHFKQQAASIIQEGEKNKFHTPLQYLNHRKNIAAANPDILTATKLMESFHEDEYGLSAKEISCLSYLIQGKSAEEIAIILSRSRRTIETHIESAKKKLHCHKISQLAYLLGKLNINLDGEK
jgi:DNA-binding CsgD family transcriptional regulator